ncbi:MAG: chromosomal replication initiator protein DnaA [Treponemataceae bacterium]
MNSINYDVFFKEVLSQIYNDFIENNNADEFTLWFSIHYVATKNENVIVAAVPTPFYKDQMIRKKYINLIESKFQEMYGKTIKIELEFNPDILNINQSNSENQEIISTKSTSEEITSSQKIKEIKTHPSLREDYTFDTFVKSDNNNFAYSASIVVSKNPGKSYNPFLIYGGVGLGKTHLMQSIGNFAFNQDKKKIIYVTAENFTNEFVESIQTKTTSKFKNKYRNADFLLIDDIHFLQKKTETQEELFHTFNALYDSYKQLVFTCDRPIAELKDMTDRLRSRFERGLTVDLQPPNFETRKAILKSKIKLHNIKIPDEVIDLIAEKIETNVRDLEACLTKLVAYADLINKDITLEIAQHQLRDAFGSPKQGNILIEDIQKVVSNHYNISYNDIKGKNRKKNIVFPRQIAMYICREITEYSTTEIGNDFGGRDHTTVLHACSKIDDLTKVDSTMSSLIQNLIKKIKELKK